MFFFTPVKKGITTAGTFTGKFVGGMLDAAVEAIKDPKIFAVGLVLLCRQIAATEPGDGMDVDDFNEATVFPMLEGHSRSERAEIIEGLIRKMIWHITCTCSNNWVTYSTKPGTYELDPEGRFQKTDPAVQISDVFMPAKENDPYCEILCKNIEDEFVPVVGLTASGGFQS